MTHSNRGETGDALALTMHSIGIRESPENKTLFAGLVSGISIDRDEPELRRFLIRALEHAWTAPHAIATACIGLIRHGPARGMITRAVQAWPARLPPAELFGGAGLAALNDPLLLALMSRTVVGDAELEKFLAACRFALLETAEAALSDESAALLELAGALARQCFINEYVYATDENEDAHARQLRDRLEAALASGEGVPPLRGAGGAAYPPPRARAPAPRVAAVAGYRPLRDLARAHPFWARPWPAPIAPLLAHQIREPREQAA